MFVFYGTKSRKEVEILKYGIITPEVRTSKAKTIGFYINKNIYVKSKGMECIDFEDFIRFIK